MAKVSCRLLLVVYGSLRIVAVIIVLANLVQKPVVLSFGVAEGGDNIRFLAGTVEAFQREVPILNSNSLVRVSYASAPAGRAFHDRIVISRQGHVRPPSI